jgi:septum formation inhibitor-activating ATPase MinD
VFVPEPKPIERPRENTLFARAEVPKPILPKKGGLFARAEAAPVVRKQEVASSGSASLASTFRRLAGQEEPVAKTSSSRPSFLKRLGRG